MKRLIRPLFTLAMIPVLAGPARAAAGAPGSDSTMTRIVYQDTVRVTASKSRSRLADLATTATIISPDQIRLGTARSVQDVLVSVPGAHILDLNGSESGGAVEGRGFAAQGTTSAMVVLIDEIPVNDFETGKVDWNLLGPSQVNRVEFLRGPASFLYGNASMAGLVNLVTLAPGDGSTAWGQVGGGDFGRANGAGGASWSASRVQGTLSGSYQKLDGYRDHSASKIGDGYGFARMALGPRWDLRARVLGHRGEQQVPGPLPDPAWRNDPKQSQTPNDDHNDRTFDGALELNGRLADRLELIALASGDAHRIDATETIQPVGAMDRTARVRSARGETRLRWTPAGTHAPELLVGAEVRGGNLQSRYFDPNNGDALVGAGDVRRASGGVFALTRTPIAGSLSLSAGARVDWLRSSLDDPTDGSPRGPNDDLRAVSPTAGLNWLLPGSGHAWVAYAGAFKAPEVEQLYDQRPYDLGFGPLHISSNVLQPQRGDHWDAGIRTRVGGAWFDGAVYYARSRNEIGFDLANFRFNNIDRSRHAGFEGELSVPPMHGISGSLSYAYTRATFEGGAHDGKQINTVPEDQAFARLSWEHRWNGSLTAEAATTRRQWIDEDDTRPLPEYTVLNVGFTQAAGAVEFFGSVRNLADEHYATLGYVAIDQFGADLPLYFPAAGRSFAAGVRMKVSRAGAR